jgi:chromosome transmission fidelity protein 1
MEFRGFPYKPYSIQIDFMKALYHSLNQGGVSILESPTGRSLSLSLLYIYVNEVAEEMFVSFRK